MKRVLHVDIGTDSPFESNGNIFDFSTQGPPPAVCC